jgi:murein DD-endopeptidase MepM/ murein hydrolase activator NlpD
MPRPTGPGRVLIPLGVALLALAPTAQGATPHTVQPGETMWSIAAANGFTTRTIAVYNGLSEDSTLVAGQTLEIPTESEGAYALQQAGLLGTPQTDSGESTSTSSPSSSAYATVTPSGEPLGHIPSPWGELHLEATAADSWNQMREAALAEYGVDLYPGGPLSAFRTYDEQAYLYNLYLSGQGAPANPPGSSTHEAGIAVDVATPEMRSVIDQIGGAYGWVGTIPSEWWHVAYVG